MSDVVKKAAETAKKPSKLKAVDPKTAEPSKPKILIFGKAGVGKTWATLDFPSVYYIDTEGGASRSHYTDKLKASGGAYFGPEEGSQSFESVIAEIKTLAVEDHSYRTLALDSGSKLYDMARQEAAEKGGDDYGRDKKEANKPARKLMNWIDRIDMNVIIICHEIPEWGLDSKGERTQTGVTFDAWAKLDYELDLALNIKKTGLSRKARVSKSRLIEFEEASSFDWSYENFAAKYGKEVIESKVKQIVLATPEQLAELNTLLEIVKLPDGEVEKWLKKANADTLADMDSAKIQACINMLKSKVKQ